jgi:hypothetical protein
MKTTTSTEEVSSHPVEKGRCEPKKHRNSPVPENNRNGLDKKFLQIYGAGRKSRKRPTLVVGKKPYGKCQFNSWKPKSFESSKSWLFFLLADNGFREIGGQFYRHHAPAAGRFYHSWSFSERFDRSFFSAITISVTNGWPWSIKDHW